MVVPSDFSSLTFVAIQAALKAGDILKKNFDSEHCVTAKPGHQNIVTECDFMAEESILSTINSHFSDHAFLAEESGISGNINSEILWIIDPLDGTVNYAHHLPFFAVSIAAYHKEEGLSSVIFQPMTNELYIAEKNKGAYLNGTRINVSKTNILGNSVLGIGFPYDPDKRSLPYLDRFTKLIQAGVSFRNLGTAVMALAYVAAGKLDGFWIDHLHPWDLAAGKLLVEEAGGTVTRYDNSKTEINHAGSTLSTNKIIHDILIKHLQNQPFLK